MLDPSLFLFGGLLYAPLFGLRTYV